LRLLKISNEPTGEIIVGDSNRCYADAKQDVIDQIMARARDWVGLAAS